MAALAVLVALGGGVVVLIAGQGARVGDLAEIERARLEGGGLGPFIRSLIGLDRKAATDALSRFSADRTPSGDQLDFVGLVVERLTANGTMDPGLLYEPPFTSVAAGGPESLFPDPDIEALIAVVRDNVSGGPHRVDDENQLLAEPRGTAEASRTLPIKPPVMAASPPRTTNARRFGVGTTNAVPDSSLGTGEFTTGGAPASFPVGFDAAVQCDSHLLQVSLVRGLEAVGALTLSAKVRYPMTLLPPEVAQAIAPLVRPVEVIRADDEIDVELRLVGPWLAGLSARYEPPAGSIVVSSGSAVTRMAAVPPGPPYQIGWTVELNLLRIEQMAVLTMGGGFSTTPGSVLLGSAPSATTAMTGRAVPAASSGTATETRTLLASGSATLAAPAQIASDASQLLMWLELDVARGEVDVSTDASLLQALLSAKLGKDMLQTALAPLTAQGSVRVSPLFALGGALSREQVVEMGLESMAVVHAVGQTSDGRWFLTLGVTFGAGRHVSSALRSPTSAISARRRRCRSSSTTRRSHRRIRARAEPRRFAASA